MRPIIMASQFETRSKRAGLGARLESVVQHCFRLIAYSVFVPLSLFLVCLNLLTLSAAAQSNNVAAYTWTTFAGTAGMGSADGVGGNAQLNQPVGVAVDANGNVYVADTDNDTIRKITPAGLVSTIAGFAGSSGSADGLNSAARFYKPFGITVDSVGNLYVVDNWNSEIRKITPLGTNWVVSTIAGRPQFDQDGDPLGGSADGTGTNALFNNPSGIAVDNANNLYVTDTGNYTIREIKLVGTNWMVSTIAGSAGNQGGDDGQNGAASFSGPFGITVDSATNLYVADFQFATIRKITPAGTNWMVTTIAGLAANSPFLTPKGIAVDSAGNLYVADQANYIIVKLIPMGPNFVVSTIAGQLQFDQDGNQIGGSADGTGTNALFYTPSGIAADSAGNLYVADTGNNTIRKVTSAVVVTTLAGLAGSAGSVDNVGGAARLDHPTDVAVDSAGNLYVTDSGNDTIRKITSEAEVTTLAGSVTNSGSTNGSGSNAQFDNPYGIAVDSTGNLYVADQNNDTIRKVTSAGFVSIIAGLAGSSGSVNGTNSTARFFYPSGVAEDANGNLYVSDTGNNTIRKITPLGTNWVVSTIAGLAGHSGSADGTGSAARFSHPYGVAVDSAGNVYVADYDYATIRNITPAGVVSTIAGLAGNNGSADGTGTNAQFVSPEGITVDNADNLYVTDEGANNIRKLTPVGTNWMVRTIGGNPSITDQIVDQYGGLIGGSMDGAGSAALFYNPEGISVDSAGNLYVTDTFNNTIRKGVFIAYAGANASISGVSGTNGALTVTLVPAAAGGQWRFGWEENWRGSGTSAGNLTAGNYPVEFRNMPGWLVIQTTTNFTVAVTNGGTTYLTNEYYPTIGTVDTNSGGSLTINIGPSAPGGAGWQFLGDTTYYPPGYSTNLVAGTYLIGFAPVSGFSQPPDLAVQVFAGLPTVLSETYLLANPPPLGVELPFPVPTNNIGNLTGYPFGFNGQLQSDVGFGSGVAVAANVVLSAAHLVFNDQTLSYVSQTYWYFQQEAGVSALQPQVARGWYVLGGYASQRTNDLQSGLYGPDQSTPQSRNLDVAALYFLSPVAGGGYSGYLPSDESPNPWLTGNSLKMLVGYPVDGSSFGDASIMPGMMYQTDPQPYALSLASDPVNDQQVYMANWFLSYPGNSGGPLYVQFNGYYYPAGVYLGILFNGSVPYASLVRAIDGEVVNLITNAQVLGDSGLNHGGPGGGVITIIPSQAVSASNPGYLEFQLGPTAAVTAGAGWRLQGDTSYSSATNYVRAVLSTNPVVVQFKPINGWSLPPDQSVSVLPGQITSYSALYTVSNPVTVTNPVLVINATGIGITGTTGTVYQIERSSSLTSGSWLPVSTNIITTTGFNLVLHYTTTNSPAAFYRALWLP
jgi:sugar lactone lactonase YvrE